MTRTGKIARLPRSIREQLNRRLQDGEMGKKLVAWLNDLPEVQKVLATEFDARAVNEQNLSEWKQRGYGEWLAKQELLEVTRELSAEAAELSESSNGLLTDNLAMVLAGRYASVLSRWDGEWDEDFRRKLRGLRGLCQDVVELRRGDHSAARLKLEQERIEAEKELTEEDLVEHFQLWAKNPKVREIICAHCISNEDRERRMREVFGCPETANQTESGQIRPARSNGDAEVGR